jgi:hypothetical protein
MKENLLRELLQDEELKKKYKLTDEMIKKASLSPPYEEKIIEYIAVIIRAKMIEHHGDVPVYNQVKNLIR